MWLGLIVHEHSHVQDFKEDGAFTFYTDYFRDMIDFTYLEIPTEKLAYKRGGDWKTSYDYTDLLLRYPSNGVIMGVLQNNNLTTKEKTNEMYKIGLSFRADFIIQDQVDELNVQISILQNILPVIAPNHPSFKPMNNELKRLNDSKNSLQQEIRNFVKQLP